MTFWQLFVSIVADLYKLAQDNMSTLGLLLFNYEEYKIKRAQRTEADAQLQLDLEKNKVTVDEKYSGKSDDAVISEFIGNGSGPKQP